MFWKKSITAKWLLSTLESGEYEIGADSLAANRRALAKDPGAALYGIRVGSDIVEKLGGGLYN